MKTWNIPAVEELEVKLTAEGTTEGTVEVKEGYLDSTAPGGFRFSTYDASIWEKDESDPTNPCLKPAKSSVES